MRFVIFFDLYIQWGHEILCIEMIIISSTLRHSDNVDGGYTLMQDTPVSIYMYVCIYLSVIHL